VPNPRELLAKALAAALDSGRITKAELSRRSGVSRSMIDGYLKQEGSATLDSLAAIAEALGTTPAALLAEETTPAPKPEPLDAFPRILGILSRLDQAQVRDLLAFLELTFPDAASASRDASLLKRQKRG
jgi:transcriptional regulator with XRE-family HTH domain